MHSRWSFEGLLANRAHVPTQCCSPVLCALSGERGASLQVAEASVPQPSSREGGTFALIAFLEGRDFITRKCHDKFTSGSAALDLWGLRTDMPFALFSYCVRYDFRNVFFAPCQVTGRDYPCQHHNVFRYFKLLAQHAPTPSHLSGCMTQIIQHRLRQGSRDIALKLVGCIAGRARIFQARH